MSQIIARVSSGIVATALGQAITIANSFVLVPVCLRYWGTLTYGEWLTLSAVISYLSLLDLGTQVYVTNRICHAYTRGELEDLHRDLHSALKLACAVATTTFMGAVLLVSWSPVDRLLNLQETTGSTATMTFLVLAGNTLLLSIPQGIVAGIYRATGAYPRGSNIGNAFRTCQFVVFVALIMAGGSMLEVSISVFLLNVISGAFMLWDLGPIRPEVRLGFRLGSFRHVLLLLMPGLQFLLMTVAGTLNAQGTVLIVS